MKKIYMVKIGKKYFHFDSYEVTGKTVDIEEATVFQSKQSALRAIDEIVGYDGKYVKKNIVVEQYNLELDCTFNCIVAKNEVRNDYDVVFAE